MNYDLLIIGAGGSGLSAAIEAMQRGAKVLMVCKTLPTRSQTVMAQGGINAVLHESGDSVESHIEDTLKASGGLADEESVRVLCKEAPSNIEWLERLGVPFSRIDGAKTPLESIAQRRLGGASAPRACYAQDYTGLKIVHTLYDKASSMGVEIRTRLFALSLIHDEEGVCAGALFLDIESGELKEIRASATIVASGGFSSIYHGYTTNAYGSSADMHSAILEAGGYLSNMEMIQFHPTALEGSAILISESARGEGGYLIDERGERFTNELAPRDEVSRAIFSKIERGGRVFLDIRHLGREKLEHLMPQELHLCRLHAGIDPVEELVPVSPAAHYSMGGIECDRQLRVSGLYNCYAAGECANAHLHGANRLGGNSLLEIVVFARMAAVNALESDKRVCRDTGETLHKAKAELERILGSEGEECDIYAMRREAGRILFEDAGIHRDAKGLEKAMEKISAMRERLSQAVSSDKSARFNTYLIDFMQLRSSLMAAEAMLVSALAREESRGAHYRSDFPYERQEWCRDTLCRLCEGEVVVS